MIIRLLFLLAIASVIWVSVILLDLWPRFWPEYDTLEDRWRVYDNRLSLEMPKTAEVRILAPRDQVLCNDLPLRDGPSCSRRIYRDGRVEASLTKDLIIEIGHQQTGRD